MTTATQAAMLEKAATGVAGIDFVRGGNAVNNKSSYWLAVVVGFSEAVAVVTAVAEVVAPSD